MIQWALQERDYDFAQLNVSSHATCPDNDSILNLLHLQEDTAHNSGMEMHPFLLELAKAELYLLSANFLLCKKKKKEKKKHQATAKG